MNKKRYTKTELDVTIHEGDIIQVVTPDIAGVGMLIRLDPYTMVLDPVDEDTLKNYMPAPPKDQVQSMDDAEFNTMPTIIPTTVIIAIEDIKLIFLLTPNQTNDDDE